MEDGQQYTESTTPTKSSPVGLVVVGIMLLLGGFYLYNQNSNKTSMPATNSKPSTEMSQTQVEASPASAVAVMEGDVKVFTLEGGSFYYKPNLIEVSKGDKVKIIMNSVSMMHDFVIDELDVKSEIAKSGSSATVEFVASKVGTFEFYCSVGQHRAQGMVGTLIVK